MKRIVLAFVTLTLTLALAAQDKVSLFRIGREWKKKTYEVCAPGGNPDVAMCVMAFTGQFYANPMMHALSAQFTNDVDNIDIPVAEFQYDYGLGYVSMRLESPSPAFAEARFLTLPDGIQRFVINLYNEDEDTLPHLCLFAVDAAAGTMTPMRDPSGLNFGGIQWFSLKPTGERIEVVMDNQPSNWIVLQPSGDFVYEAFATNDLWCFVYDTDPSGRTNIRATPGGKVIGQLGAQPSDEDDEGGVYCLSVYNPRNGWWQILDKSVGGIEIQDQGWIHSSVLALSTRNYDGSPLNLYAEPSADASVSAVIREADVLVRPLDITADGKWTKVICKAGTGWLQTRWLCGNPFTTCP